jgi:hypothetical protein
MTPNDLRPISDSPFIRAMVFQCYVEQVRSFDIGMYLAGADGKTSLYEDLDPTPFVRRTPPFSTCQPGMLRDVRNGRCIACPHDEALVGVVHSM